MEVCEAAFVLGQLIHFSKGACTTGKKKKKHSLQSQHFPLHPLSQLLNSEDASSEPIILSRAELYCTWHILESSHCGLRSVFSFHPTKRKSSGPGQSSTIPGSLLGDCGRARRSWRVLIEPHAMCYWGKESENGGKGIRDIAREVSILFGCVYVVVSQDPAGPRAPGHMSGAEEGRQPSLRHWPVWSRSCSLGNTVSSSERHPACATAVIK